MMSGLWCFEDFLALAKEVVGVTHGISCVAAMVLHVPGMDRGSCYRYHAGYGCHWGCVVGFRFRGAACRV